MKPKKNISEGFFISRVKNCEQSISYSIRFFVLLCAMQSIIVLTPRIINISLPTATDFYVIPFSIVLANAFSWLLLSCFMYLLSSLIVQNVPSSLFRSIVGMVVAAGIIEALASAGSLLSGLLGWFFRPEAGLQKLPLPGLAVLFAGIELPAVLLYIAQHITVFTVWYLGIVTILLSQVLHVSRRKSSIITVAAWICRVLVLWGGTRAATALLP
jgi:hypothetical protein